jgi:HlyD family secretion protein
LNLHSLKNPRVLAGIGFVLAILAVALWPRSAAVDMAAVERGPLRVTIDEEGETRVRDRFVVTAPVAGRVQRVELEPGDPVKAQETVLATFLPADPVPLDARSRAEAEAAQASAAAAVDQARAERSRAAAALQLARSEAARARDLAKENVLSPQLLEAREAEARQAEEALHAAEAAVAAARHGLEMARVRLAPTGGRARPIVLRSPIDGVVLRRHRESESVVAAGEPILDVGDPRKLEIVSDLLSTDAVKVAPGAAVVMEQWGGETPLEGRVRRVEPSGFMKISALGVEEQRVNVIIDPAEPGAAWERLGDAYRVEVRIVTWERPDVVRAPTSALFRRGDGWAVFVEEGGRARLRNVRVGQVGETHAEVLDGLQPGTRVVVHPADTLADGARIHMR